MYIVSSTHTYVVNIYNRLLIGLFGSRGNWGSTETHRTVLYFSAMFDWNMRQAAMNVCLL